MRKPIKDATRGMLTNPRHQRVGAVSRDEMTDGAFQANGRVKWFDPVKGFGFVVADDGSTDILLHANVLRNFGQNSIADNAEVRLMVVNTPRGAQATEVLEILSAGAIEPEENAVAPETLNELPLLAARVKWFDKSKGFGFANVFGRTEDVFVHIETLRRTGFADLQPGEAIAVRIVDSVRGKMAVEVRSWDSAS